MKKLIMSLSCLALLVSACNSEKKEANATDSPKVEVSKDVDTAAMNKAWVADITYIRTGSGWLYLAAVMNLYSRKIVGYSMSNRMTTNLVCTALQIAIHTRQPSAELIMHTDRGSQYYSIYIRIYCYGMAFNAA